MKSLHFRSLVAVAAISGILWGAGARPAQADTASTLVEVATIATGLAIQGHTADGATVYYDNHVVNADGSIWYPLAAGQTITCTSGICLIFPASYVALPKQPDYGQLVWTAFTLPGGQIGEWADSGSGQFYYFGPDHVLYLDAYPGEVLPQDVSSSAVGNVDTYDF